MKFHLPDADYFPALWFFVGVQTLFTCVFPFEAPKAENSKANPVKYVQCEAGGGGLHLRFFIVTRKQKRLFFSPLRPPGIFVLGD